MNIVHIVRGDFTPQALNGVYKVIDSLSAALTDVNRWGGVNVTVCSVSPNPHSDIYQPQGYRHVQVREPSLRFFLAKEFQRFLLSQPRDTIFHFHSVFIPWFLPAMRLLRRHGYQRIILTPHGQYTDAAMNRSLKKRMFFHLFDSKVVSLASAVHIIGHTEENDHITRNARRWQLIPNGCTPQPPRKGTGRQLVFSYLGRMDATQKGLDTLIQAFAFHRQQGGHGTLRLAGDGADLAALQKLVRQLGVANEVEFTGKLFGERKQQFLDASAFFLHPSRWDVVPTACMEAAASGVPLIINRATCLDTYTERYNAGCVTTDDGRPVLALATAMAEAERLFENKAQYQALCANAQRMVSEELNWENITRKVVELLYTI